MNRSPLPRNLLLALIVVLIAACSTEKDAFLNRTYHRLTARDNGWFNANEKLKETVAAMEKAYVDDYDEVLPIFIYGTEEQAKGLVPDLEKCIEKCSVVIERHSMDNGKGETNTWIDDAYFVIGKSHFYKRAYFDAERTFEFAGRRFKGQDRQLESKLWSARTAIQNEQYAKAQSALDEVKNQKELPKKFPHDQLSAIQADVNLKRGKVDDAIVDLEHASEIARNRTQKTRWMFILAQLYMAKGMEEKAIAQFKKVARSHPPYELGFHAEIFQALSFDRGNSTQLRKKLKRMRKDEKNKDHYDMIEYAMADIDLKENKDSTGIAHLKTSARVSTIDTKQKAKSFLKLADLYFDDKKYPSAQQYYDSTRSLLAETHKRFEEVNTRADVLNELVEQLDIIAFEDSVQAFAKLPKEEQEKLIKQRIKERQREEDDKEAAEAAAREVESTTGKDNPKPQPGGNNSTAWYFYNPTQISRGSAEFKKKWGTRTNEDEWRRKDKAGSAFAEEPEELENDSSEVAKDGKDGEPAWKDPESYMKDVPVDSVALEASNIKICSALYISGTIYKEKLKDIDAAIESFQVLNSRFDECQYTAESYYQLYRIYLAKEKTGFVDFEGRGSAYYADIIQERWPDSEFARLVRDPNQLMADEERKKKEESDYVEVYRQYRERSYFPVIATCTFVITETPKNHLLPKYHLLKAMAIGGTREAQAFRTALAEVLSKFPGSDEAKAAADIMATLDKGASATPNGSAPPDVVAAPQYSPTDGPHFVALLFPNAVGPVDPPKARISDFNQANFPSQPLQVDASVLDANNQIIKVGPFANKAKAMEYYNLFMATPTLSGLNDAGHVTFAISTANFATFYKDKDIDAYASFFSENYLQGQ